MLAVMLENGDI